MDLPDAMCIVPGLLTSHSSPGATPVAVVGGRLPSVDEFRRLSCERKVQVFAQALEENQRLQEGQLFRSLLAEVKGLKRAVEQLQEDRDRHQTDMAEHKAEVAGMKKAADAQMDELEALREILSKGASSG